MSNFSLGSIAARAYDGLNDVPVAISGAIMTDIAYQSLLFVNNFLKTSIGSNSISDAHQSPMINFTKAWTLARMAQIGAGFDWHLGEFSVTQAGNSVESIQVKAWFDMAISEIKMLQTNYNFYKANG